MKVIYRKRVLQAGIRVHAEEFLSRAWEHENNQAGSTRHRHLPSITRNKPTVNKNGAVY